MYNNRLELKPSFVMVFAKDVPGLIAPPLKNHAKSFAVLRNEGSAQPGRYKPLTLE